MPFIEMQGEVPNNLPSFISYQAYNCLDSAVTAQLLPVMLDNLNRNTQITYERELRVLALCIEMSSKGFPVDQHCLNSLLFDLQKNADRALHLLHRFCAAVDFRPLNPRSTKDVQDLFYMHLKLPPIYEYNRQTKQRKLSTDIKALEKLQMYPVALPFIKAILAFRAAAKMGSVFKRGLEPDTGNLRCNFSPSGTETGRLSSQMNPYGRGTNAQNLTDKVRQVVTAPKGFCILNFDLKTAESIAVGFCSGDMGYIKACLGEDGTGEHADLHTMVCKMNWQHLAWTDDLKQDKAIAESPYYRHFSYRDMAKRGGHLSNYYGQPRAMAMHLKLPIEITEAFQQAYFTSFPGLPEWHIECVRKVQQDGKIVTALNRERTFWGRPDDQATWREAIAYEPQSLVGDVMNEGLVQVQQWIKAHLPESRLLLGRRGALRPFNPRLPDLRAQVHDAGVFIVPLDGVEQIAAELTERLKFPVDFGSKGVMNIPNDVMWGKRWCKAKGKGFQAEGLVEYKPGMIAHWEDR